MSRTPDLGPAATAALLGLAAAVLFAGAMCVLAAVMGKANITRSVVLGVGLGVSTAVKEYRRRGNPRELG